MAEEETINLEDQAIEKSLSSGEGTKEELEEEGKKAEAKPKEPSLEERIAGLETGISRERDKRRAASEEANTLKGQLLAVQDVLAESMAKREEAAAASNKEEAEVFGDLTVDVDDDGKAFIPKEAVGKAVYAAVKEALKAEGIVANQETIEEIKNQFFFEHEEQARDRAFKEHVNMLLLDDDNESFSGNFPKLEKAQQWFSGQIIQYQQSNRIDRQFSVGEAIDVAQKSDISEKFAKKFPTLNFEKVARMYESDYDFGQALKSVGGGNTNKGNSASMSNLKKLANKASNLSGVTNQKAVGGELTLDSIADMSVAEMEKLSPEDAKKIEKILESASA